MLNDNHVQYMLKKLYFSLDNVKQNSIFFHETLFYGQLMDNEIEKFNYNLVKKWTKRVNLFEKDFIFIPINKDKHWSLICIVGLKNVKWNNGKPANISQYSAQENVPSIIFLDSLNMHPYETFVENILK
jgi:sentrin-specific protease 7